MYDFFEITHVMRKIISALLIGSLSLILMGCGDAEARRRESIGREVEDFVKESKLEKKEVVPEVQETETYFMDFYGYSFEVPEGYGLTEFYEEDNQYQPDIIYMSKEPIPLEADIGTYTSLAVWPAKTAEEYLGLVEDETGYTALGTETINGYEYSKISIDMNLNVPYTRISYIYDIGKDFTVAIFSYDQKNEAEAKPFLETLNFL